MINLTNFIDTKKESEKQKVNIIYRNILYN